MAGPLKMRQPVKLKCQTCGFDGNPADAKRCMVCDELLGSIVLRSASLLSDSLINWLYHQSEEFISGVVALEQEKRIQRAKNTKGGLELMSELSYYFVDAIHTVLKIKLKNLKIKLKKVLERII
jgi:hypothetical protein